MRTLLAVYGVTALLLAAGAGPASQAVRDASLGEIETLEEPRALGEFGFLKVIRPYLPPLVVDWLVVKRTTQLDFPDDVDIKVDPDGRFILVWPEGCEETYDKDHEGERGPGCPEPEDDVCAEQDGARHQDRCGAACTDGRDPDDHGGACPEEVVCAPGEDKRVNDDGSTSCTLRECPDEDDNATADGNRTTDTECDPPPAEGCPDHTIEAYDGTCVPRAAHKLWQRSYAGSRDGDDAVNSAVELKVPYRFLTLEVRYSDQARDMNYTFDLSRSDTDSLCWQLDGAGCRDAANGQDTRPVPDDERVYDNWTATDPGSTIQGNHTIGLSYTEGRFPTASPAIRFTLFGQPADPSEA